MAVNYNTMYLKQILFKSKDGETIGPLELNRELNVLFGDNGAGKTRTINMLYAFKRLNQFGLKQALRMGYWEMLFAEGKTEYKYILDIEFNKNKRLEICQDSLVKMKNGEEEILFDRKSNQIRENDIKSGTNSVLGDYFPEEYELSIQYATDQKKHRSILSLKDEFTNFVRLEHSLGTSRATLPGKDPDFFGGDIVQIINFASEEKEKFSIVKKYFKSIFPQVEEIKLKNEKYSISHQEGLTMNLERFLFFKEKNLDEYGITEASSGFLKIMILLIALFKDNSNLILIDEFDTGLDYKTLVKITEIIFDFSYAENKQILLTTHSPILADIIDFKYWKIAKRNKKKTEFFNIEKNKELQKYKKGGMRNFEIMSQNLFNLKKL